MTFSRQRPSQRPDELAEFIELLHAEDVRSYLEIGARDGDSFHAIVSSLPVGSRGVAVDMPGGPWGRDSRRHLQLAVADLQKKGYEARAIFGDSKALATRQLVRLEAPFDVVLIDGDHRIEGVTADWVNYGAMARLVAFHDIDGRGITTKAGMRVEVPALWDVLAVKYKSRAIIGKQRGMGIGVLWP